MNAKRLQYFVLGALLATAGVVVADELFGGGGSGGGAATSITTNSTTVTGGTDTAVCYEDGTKIRCDATSPTWTKGTGTEGLVAQTGVAATITTSGVDTDSSLNLRPKGLDDGNFANSVFISPLANPTTTLAAIVANFVSPSLIVESDTGANSGDIAQVGVTSGSGPALYQLSSRGSLGTPTIVQAQDGLGLWGAAGYDGIAYRLAARISVAVDATPGAGDMPGRIDFWTTPDGSTTLVNSWRMGNDGNLTTVGANHLLKLGTDGAVTVNNVAGNILMASTDHPVKTFTATYDPGTLAAQTARTDTVTVTGIKLAGGAVSMSLGVDPAAGCVLGGVRASADDTVKVTWFNAITAVTACDTATSTATFTQQVN